MPTSARDERRLQRRAERQKAQRQIQRKDQARRMGVMGGLIAAIAAVIVAVVLLVGRRPPAAPLPGTHFNDPVTAAGQLYQHVASGSKINYSHYPPTFGPHYGTPDPWGAYDSPVPAGTFVHDLEHGGIVMLYHCPAGCPQTVSQLKGLLTTLPKDRFGEVKVIISPYDKSTQQISLLAWDYEQDLNSFNASAIKAFYQAHVDKGPEKVA